MLHIVSRTGSPEKSKIRPGYYLRGTPVLIEKFSNGEAYVLPISNIQYFIDIIKASEFKLSKFFSNSLNTYINSFAYIFFEKNKD